MNIPYSMIAVGCSGRDQEESSFVGQLSREANCACLTSLSRLDEKRSGEDLQSLINEYNPDIILWQDEPGVSGKGLFGRVRRFVMHHIVQPLLPFLARRMQVPHVRIMKSVIDRNPRKYFIILSPQPATSRARNRVAYNQAALLKSVFSQCPNVTYINLMHSMKQPRNGRSAAGNWSQYFLAHLVAKKSGLSLFTGRGNFAA